MTVVRKMNERIAHARQFIDPTVQFGDVLSCNRLHFGACTRAVLP